MMTRILHFEEIALRILPAGADGLFTVQVTQSSYGSQASCKADFAAWQARTEDGELDTASAQTIGDRLFRALFAGPVLDTFLQLMGRVEAKPDTGLRIRLHLDPSLPDLAAISALPWELLYRAETRDFLARNPLTPFVRYLEVPRLTGPAPLESSLRILVVRSRPSDLDRLDLDTERDRIVDAWGGDGRIEIDFLDHPTLLSLRRKLISEPFHVLHFMGHGDFNPATGEGVLAFEDGSGQSALVSGQVLGQALQGSRCLRLVFLNACDTAQLPRHRGQDPFSGVASALVLAGLPTVLAMQLPISDSAALVFSQHFYTALALGFPVDAAAAEARLAIHLASPSSWEWAIPVLFMSVPDGRILNPDPDLARGPLSRLDRMDPVKKRDLLAHLQNRVRDVPEDPQAHFLLGLSSLDLRCYEQALDSLRQALAQGSREPGLSFYIALASLGGRQPRTLTFQQIKTLEASLTEALGREECAETLLLLAILKSDYYRSNGLRMPPPPIEDLLAAARRCQSSLGDAPILAKYLTVPAALR